METSSNVSKIRKDIVQSECSIPEERGLEDAIGNLELNINQRVEPNFNLNLNLTSPSNPRPITDALRLQGGNKKDNGSKGGKQGLATETGKSPVEKDDPSRQKSKIPLARSPKAESANSRGDQRLKSPNPKRTPTLSPKTSTQGNMVASPKPQRVEQLTAGSPRATERVKSLDTEPASATNPAPNTELTTKTTNKIPVSLKMQPNKTEDCGKETSIESPKTLHFPVSLKIQNQKGDSNVISPKLANRTPTLTAKSQKLDPKSNEQNQQNKHDAKTPSVSETHGPKSPNQKHEVALLSPKTPQPSSLSPKPSTQRKVAVIRSRNTTRSEENLESKDSSASGSKTSSKSKDSLDPKSGSVLKASPNTKRAMGSKDSLDSKSGSASKTSLGSKDSLDSKTASNSKISPSSKSGMGSRDSLDLKETTGQVLKTETESQSSNLKMSPASLKPGLDSFSNFKLSPTSSASRTDLAGSTSPSASRISLSVTKDKNLRSADPRGRPNQDPSETSKPAPVRSSSNSALADLTLSPRPSSASRSPGSGPSRSLGTSPNLPNKGVQRSVGSASGKCSQGQPFQQAI